MDGSNTSGTPTSVRRDHSPFRGQMAKAIRAVRAQERKLYEGYLREDIKGPITGREVARRIRWHQAWVDYGDALAEQRRLDRCSSDQIE